MKSLLRCTIRLATALGIAAFVWIPVPGDPGNPPGRDFSRCTKACNDFRASCHIRLMDDCWVLYQTEEEREACVAYYDEAVCIPQAEACKYICWYYTLKGHDQGPEP